MKPEERLPLHEDPALSDTLREDLRAARAHPPNAFDLPAGLARFEATLEAAEAGDAATDRPGDTPVDTSSPKSATGLTTTKLGLLLTVGIGGALLATLAWTSTPREMTPRQEPQVATEPEATTVSPTTTVSSEEADRAQPVPAQPVPAQPVRAEPAPDETSGAVPGDRPRERPRSQRNRASNEASVASPASPPRPQNAESAVTPGSRSGETSGSGAVAELRQLVAAREALRRSPAEALTRAEEGHRRFPQGQLREEREALAIRALVRLGRAQLARERAQRFFRRYPDSSFAAQLEQATRVESDTISPEGP